MVLETEKYIHKKDDWKKSKWSGACMLCKNISDLCSSLLIKISKITESKKYY